MHLPSDKFDFVSFIFNFKFESTHASGGGAERGRMPRGADPNVGLGLMNHMTW